MMTAERLEKVMQAAGRFWKQVEKTPDCWPWKGVIRRDGYGKLGFNGWALGAHRISWILANGAIPDGLFVLHSCDNPRCVRPSHLRIGTHRENVADRNAKGRHSHGDSHRAAIRRGALRGEASPTAKLTAAKVEEMRRLYAAGGITQIEIARRFELSYSHTHKILRGGAWPTAQATADSVQIAAAVRR